MSQEDIERLKAELNQLRRENQRLRTQAAPAPIQGGAPTPNLPDQLPPTNILPAFHRQLQQTQRANRQLQAAQEHYEALTKSLAALVPALEVQVNGWSNTIQNLQVAQQDTEQTYAGVVHRLEEKIKLLKNQLMEASSGQWQRKFTELERETIQLRKQVKVLTETCARYEAAQTVAQPEVAPPASSVSDDNQDPFSNLNIFEI